MTRRTVRSAAGAHHLPRSRRAVAAGLVWCAVGRLAGAQLPGVAIDPHLVVLSSAQPTGELTVFNPRASAAEYEISLRYGYATTDAAGRPTVRLADPPPGTVGGGSAAAWVTAYPRRFVVQPGGWQTVRLVGRPPDGIADGEYWARLTVHARDLAPPPALALAGAALAGVRATLAVETATVLPVLYRAGAVTTGVHVDALRATIEGDSVTVAASLRRTGNAAFLGTATIAVYDTAGDTSEPPVAHLTHPIAVYGDAAPRWRVPVPARRLVSGGGWRVELRLATERDDVPQRLILSATPVRRSAPVRPE